MKVTPEMRTAVLAELETEKCLKIGHDFTILLQGHDPANLECRRCHSSWVVERRS